jgi:hypothetical protein
MGGFFLKQTKDPKTNQTFMWFLIQLLEQTSNAAAIQDPFLLSRLLLHERKIPLTGLVDSVYYNDSRINSM